MNEPSASFLKDAVFLVDASSYIFRAYYAIQRPLHAPDGTPTHATYGFLQMIQSLIEMHGLSHCVLVWDRPEKGFRHEIFPEYKANRTSPPEDLGIQLNNARDGATHLGIPQLDAKGFEADDILATIITKNPASKFVIVTADKDLLQLVGPNVWCLDTMKRKWSNIDEAREKFGVEPNRISEVQALSGDSVDNVPGIPGVGPKTAMDLIQTFGTLENVLATAQQRVASGGKDWKDKLKGKCLENVANNPENARLSLKLVTLHSDVPVPVDLSRLAPTPVDKEGILAWSQKLGFQKTAAKLLEFYKVLRPEAGEVAIGATTEAPVRAPSGAVRAAPTSLSSLLDMPAVPRPVDFTTRAITSLEELRQLFQGHPSSLLSVDTETFSLDHLRPHNIVGFSLSFDGQDGIYVPLRHTEPSVQNLNPKEALAILQQELDRRTKAGLGVVLQNAKFDLHAFANDGIVFPNALRIDDTMVASFVLSPSEKHGLDALAVKHLEGYQPVSFDTVTAGKKDFSEVALEQATFYAAEDAVICGRLWKKLSAELQAEKLWHVYDGIDRPVIPILLEMERNGIVLNPEPLQELSNLFHKELQALQEKAIESLRESGLEVSPDLNLNSPKQVGVILYEKLNLPVLKKMKTGPSTDVSVLEELAAMHTFPEILLEIREISKLLSTYVDSLPKLINPSTGRVHTDFSQTIAATGRLSSSNPNLQNIPIKTRRGMLIRKAFEAQRGCVLLGVDYSQIELRLLAHVSQDPELLKAFNEDADIHRRTAALVLNKKESEVSDDDRRMAKAINYGIVYGQTAFGLARALKVPRNVAQTFIDNYFKTYTGIQGYMKSAVEEAKKTGAVRTLSGRRRLLPEIHSKNGPVRQFAERMAINTPLQGLAADLMKVGMIRVKKLLDAEFPDAKLLLQVHDELVFEVPEARAEALKKRVVEEIEDRNIMQDFDIKEFSVSMKAQASVGHNWSEI